MKTTIAGSPTRYRHSVIPHIFVSPAAPAISFYIAAFGAREIFRVARPDGAILHGEVAIGEAIFMVGDPDGVFQAPAIDDKVAVGLHVYVADVDAIHGTALANGARSLSAPQNMFYGDRMAMLRDPFGRVWVLLQHLSDMTPDEIKVAGEKLLAG